MDNTTTEQVGHQTYHNPIEDQRREALDHYDKASSAIHHWSSFVEAAIKAYNPSTPAPDTGKGLEEVKDNCQHQALNDSGVGYYHCPMCDKSWTYKEWEETYSSPFYHPTDESAKVDTVEWKVSNEEYLRPALNMLVRVFEKAEKTKEQQKFFDSAKNVLQKTFNPMDILRENHSGKVDTGSEGVDEADRQDFQDWWNSCKPQYRTPEIIFDHFKRYYGPSKK